MASLNPNGKVYLVFLPGQEFEMRQVVPLLIGFDFLGLVLGWRVLDHAAHLGGALYGWLYTNYGYQWWSKIQTSLLKWRTTNK